MNNLRLQMLCSTCVLGVSLFVQSRALAHGREPSVGQITFDRTNPDHFVMRSTWALLTTHDNGRSFTWTCATAAGFDRIIEDPPLAIAESAALIVGTFDGIRRSDPSGCGYFDGQASTRGAFAIDVQEDSTGAIWTAMSPGDEVNTVQRSTDSGLTFTTVGAAPEGVLLEKLRIAPSDPMRVYASGAIPSTASMPRRAVFLHSEDGGVTFTRTELPLLTIEERNAHVLAVDPTNPSRVLVRIVRRVTDTVPERLLLSEDGGLTFRTVLELVEMTGVVFSHDGAHVWVGGWDGGFMRSDDGGRTFTTLDADLRVRCLAERAAADGSSDLFVCVDAFTQPYAVARSSDLGASLARFWGFSDAVNDVGCSACTDVGGICPAYWPDVVFDLALTRDDAGPPPGPIDAGARVSCDEAGTPLDAGSTQPPSPPPSGCGCRVESAPSRAAWLPLALGLLLVLRRRRAA